jgi:5-carboxymethyl-2-hydroxymuconate isomerase
MVVRFALAAAVSLGSVDTEVPPRVTPIVELATADRLRHAEVIRIERDFGRENVDVAIDAWMPAHDARRIEGVRMWWSDDVDRYPFSDRLRERLGIRYRRVRPDRWRVSVRAEGQRVTFDVALQGGRPRVLADVIIPGNRLVRQCRVDAAHLQARRVLGIAVGLRKMAVTCTGRSGKRHRGTVRPSRR